MHSRIALLLSPRISASPALAGKARTYGTRLESKPWKQRPNRNPRLALILTEDVPDVGRRGHVVRVKRKYGRNWLLPLGKAVYATPDNMKLYDAKELPKDADSEADVVAFVENLFAKQQITIPVPSDTFDRGGWGVYEHHIVEELRRFRLHVPLDCILISSPLTSLGVHPVVLRVDESTEIPFTVDITPRSSQSGQRPTHVDEKDHSV